MESKHLVTLEERKIMMVERCLIKGILIIDHDFYSIVIIDYSIPAVDVVFVLAVVVSVVMFSVGMGWNRVAGGNVSDKVVGLPV